MRVFFKKVACFDVLQEIINKKSNQKKREAFLPNPV